MTIRPFRSLAVLALGAAMVFAGAPVAQAATPDASVASSVVGVVRTSSASVASGGTVSFLWKVRDRGATNVSLTVTDVLGGQHDLTWNGTASMSGVLSATVDSSKWPAGAYQATTMAVYAANGSVIYQPSHRPTPQPSGLKVVPPTNLKFPALGFTVASDPSAPDLSVASSVVGVVRTSAASVTSGGTVSFLWKVRDRGATNVSLTVTDPSGHQHDLSWDGTASMSGVLSTKIDSAKWAPGAYWVSSLVVSTSYGSVNYQPGRRPTPNPYGLKVVPPTNLKFPALGFTVG